MNDDMNPEHLPNGIDMSELLTSEETRDVNIEYNGKNWTFTIRDLTWLEESDVETAAIKINVTGTKNNAKKNVTLNTGIYNTEYLKKAIVKAPFKLTPLFFMRMDPKLGELLINAVIGDSSDDEAAKNYDTPLEA